MPDRGLAATTELLYRLEEEQDLDAWAALWADDSHVLFPHSRDRSGELHGKQAIVDVTRQKFVDRDKVEIGLRVEPMADGRRVVAHLDATIHFAAGPVLTFPLLVILTFDADGLITTMEEYVNEKYLES